MPAFPHPLTLEDQWLRRNRWRERRALWSQTLFLFAMYAALAMAALAWWLQADVSLSVRITSIVVRYEVALAVAALVAGAFATRRLLYRDAARHFASAYAAMPVWREVQARRDTRVRVLLILKTLVGMSLILVLLAVKDAGDALRVSGSLAWSALALALATIFTPAPGADAAQRLASSAPSRLAHAPRWLAALSVPALPHLPQWWWQRAGHVWLRGRASTTLAVGLLLAPMEAAAILVPVVLLMLAALGSALDVAHRLAADLTHTLAARPPTARLLWRALWPLHATLVAVATVLVLALLHGVQAPGALSLIAVVSLLTFASIDLLLAIELRRTPRRLAIARTQVVLISTALASGLPLMLPVFVAALLWTLTRRVWRDAAHA